MKSFTKFTTNPFTRYKELDRFFNKSYISPSERGIFEYTHYGVYQGTPKSNKRALRSTYANSNMSPFDKIVNLSMVSGLRQKSFLTLSRAFAKLIYILKFEQDVNKLTYMASRYLDFVLVQNIKAKSSASVNDFLSEVMSETSPIFNLKTQKSQIKKRSKKGQKYKVYISYVKPQSRNLVALKWLISDAQ